MCSGKELTSFVVVVAGEQNAEWSSLVAQKDRQLEVLVAQLPTWQDQMRKLTAEVRQMRKTRKQDTETIQRLTTELAAARS